MKIPLFSGVGNTLFKPSKNGFYYKLRQILLPPRVFSVSDFSLKFEYIVNHAVH